MFIRLDLLLACLLACLFACSLARFIPCAHVRACIRACVCVCVVCASCVSTHGRAASSLLSVYFIQVVITSQSQAHSSWNTVVEYLSVSVSISVVIFFLCGLWWFVLRGCGSVHPSHSFVQALCFVVCAVLCLISRLVSCHLFPSLALRVCACA